MLKMPFLTLSPEWMDHWMDFNQTCTDKSLGDGKELIRYLVTLTSFSRSLEVNKS